MILRAQIVVPLDGPPIADGAVVVHGSEITAVGPAGEILADAGDQEVRDLGEMALLPGLINAHCHLDYTVLRPAWFTSDNEVDFEITHKGEPERGSVISQKSLATFITQIIESPEKYARESLGINKPR